MVQALNYNNFSNIISPATKQSFYIHKLNHNIQLNLFFISHGLKRYKTIFPDLIV